METESLFKAARPHSNEAPLADAPRILSVGVFPKVAEEPVVSEVKQGWFAKIKGLFQRKQRVTETLAVQTEWSLDRVTVVRNDLSDTDFEVVVSKAGIAEGKSKGKSLVGSAWKRAEVSVAKPEPVDTLK